MSEERQQELARKRARELRFKKTIVSDLNLYDMSRWLNDIAEEIGRIEWIGDSRGGTRKAFAELIGDEDEAAEFETCFAILEGDIEKMNDELYEVFDGDEWDGDDPELKAYDDFLVACKVGGQRNGYMGYDEYEGDFFGIKDPYEERMGIEESQKRLERLTKKQLIEKAQQSFSIVLNFLSLERRYDHLHAAMEMMEGTYGGQLEIMGELNQIYEKQIALTEYERNWHKFDAMLADMPDDVWVE